MALVLGIREWRSSCELLELIGVVVLNFGATLRGEVRLRQLAERDLDAWSYPPARIGPPSFAATFPAL